MATHNTIILDPGADELGKAPPMARWSVTPLRPPQESVQKERIPDGENNEQTCGIPSSFTAWAPCPD